MSASKTIVIREGDAGLSAYQVAVENGFTGTEAEWLEALQGGQNGWSPQLGVIEDGERRIHQIRDWTGGTGLKPAVGAYLGPLGPTAVRADATDIRGSQGAGNGTGDSTHANRTDNPHGVTKAQVGLGNVNNTSDDEKPVSAAQALAISTAQAAAVSAAAADATAKVSTAQAAAATDATTKANAAQTAAAVDATAKAGAVQTAAAADATAKVDEALIAASADATAKANAARAASLPATAPGTTVAPLVSGLIPSMYLPSFVDDVLEFASVSAFPATGESGKLYVALDTNQPYRWGGSTYVVIVGSPGNSDAVPEGATNKYYTDARAAAAAPVQSVNGRAGVVVVTKADLALGNVTNTSDADKPVSTAQGVAISAARSGAEATAAADATTKANAAQANAAADATAKVNTAQTAAAADATAKANAAQANAAADATTKANAAQAASLPVTAPGTTVAPLVGGLIPSSYLPSYVDDVLEFATLAAFPATGETGKLYVAINTNFVYRWSGSAYILIVSSPGSTDAVPEGTTNKYFTDLRAQNALAATLANYLTITAANSQLASNSTSDRARGNHTGTQTASTISDFSTAANSAVAAAVEARAPKGALTAAGLTISAANRVIVSNASGQMIEAVLGTGLSLVGNELRATASAGTEADLVQGLSTGLTAGDAAANALAIENHIIARANASGAAGFGLAVIPVGRWRVAWTPNVAALKAAGVTRGFAVVGKAKKGCVLVHNYDEVCIKVDNSSSAGAPLAVSEVVIANQVAAGGSGSVASRLHRLQITDHDYVANDLIHLSTQIVKSFQPNARIGESIRVRAVEGNYVWVDGLLGYRDEYNAGGLASMVARKLDKTWTADLYNFTVEPLTDSQTSNPPSRVFSIIYTAVCRSGFDHLVFNRSWVGAIRLESCCDMFSGSGVEWNDAFNRPATGTASTEVLVSQITYTFQFYGACFNCLIQGGRSIGWRHAPTGDGRSSGPGSAPWAATGDPFQIIVQNFDATGSKGSPYDTHPEGGDWFYLNCISRFPHGADNSGSSTYSGNHMQVRARRVTVFNLMCVGGNGGIKWNMWNHGPDDWLKIINTRIGPCVSASDASVGLGVNENQALTSDRRRLILENVTVDGAGRNIQITSGTVDVEYRGLNSLRPVSGHINVTAAGVTWHGTNLYWDSDSAVSYGANPGGRTLWGIQTVGGVTYRIVGLTHKLGTISSRHTPAIFRRSVNGPYGDTATIHICDIREIDPNGLGERPLILSGHETGFTIASRAQGHVRGLGLNDGTLLTATTIADGQMVVRSGNNLVGMAIPSGGGSGGAPVSGTWTMVVAAADVVNADATANTLADITGLSFPGTPGEVYAFRAQVAYDVAASTTGARFVASGPTLARLNMRSLYSSSSTGLTINAAVPALDQPTNANTTSAAAGNFAELLGQVEFSAAGNFQLRFASEVAGSAVTVLRGSNLQYIRVL